MAVREPHQQGADRVNWFDEYVARIDGVQGGEPVLRGTRTPVRTIAVLFREIYPGDLGQARASLPHLQPIQVDAALAYYAAHKAEINDDIARHRQILEEFAARS